MWACAYLAESCLVLCCRSAPLLTDPLFLQGLMTGHHTKVRVDPSTAPTPEKAGKAGKGAQQMGLAKFYKGRHLRLHPVPSQVAEITSLHVWVPVLLPHSSCDCESCSLI